jgi:uncharacterized protein (UPF0179 family)
VVILDLIGWVEVVVVTSFMVVTVAPGGKAAEGSVIELRNEVNAGCDQARAQKPRNKNRNARGWRKQRMRTPSKKNTISR